MADGASAQNSQDESTAATAAAAQARPHGKDAQAELAAATATAAQAGDAATAGANLAYLRGAWCGSSYGNDPAARATFGRQRGVDSLVYRRENY